MSVQLCEKFLTNKCTRNDEECWYNHKLKESGQKMPKGTQNQVFQKDSRDPLPPDHVTKAIQDLCLKMENMEEKINILMKKH